MFFFRYFRWDQISSIQWNYRSTEKWHGFKVHWRQSKENQRNDKTSPWQSIVVDEAYPLKLKSEKDFGKEASESILRCMLSSNGSVQHPVFIFAGCSSKTKHQLICQGLHEATC